MSVSKKDISIEDIELAIKNNNFDVFLQQKIASDGTLVGAEALARWNQLDTPHSLPPSFFINHIESNPELMVEFTKSIYLSTLSALEKLLNNGFSGKLSFNVSAIDLTQLSDLSTFIRDTTPDSMMKHLEIEITESLPILPKDEAYSVEQIKQISELGMSIAIDDVGAENAYGFLIFETLKDYVSTVKIDKRLADTLVDPDSIILDNDAIELMQIINDINISSNNSPNFVLEGIAKDNQGDLQIDILKNNGLDYIATQGYHDGIPLCVTDFIDKFQHQLSPASNMSAIKKENINFPPC
jgi:sensor c-di-GMP phosphodiesterase-like protein